VINKNVHFARFVRTNVDNKEYFEMGKFVVFGNLRKSKMVGGKNLVLLFGLQKTDYFSCFSENFNIFYCLSENLPFSLVFQKILLIFSIFRKTS
jgi:hypothetical protein